MKEPRKVKPTETNNDEDESYHEDGEEEDEDIPDDGNAIIMQANTPASTHPSISNSICNRGTTSHRSPPTLKTMRKKTKMMRRKMKTAERANPKRNPNPPKNPNPRSRKKKRRGKRKRRDRQKKKRPNDLLKFPHIRLHKY